MDSEKRISSRNSNTPRRGRVKRMKMSIVVIALILLILPAILCVIMFFKLNYLQKQIDILMLERYGVTYTGQRNTSSKFLAHAASIYNSSLKVFVPAGKSDGNKKTESGVVKKTNKSTYIDSSRSKAADAKTDGIWQEDTSNKEESEFKDFAQKTVYITFDDGPSKYTEEILKVLKDYNIKAAFFVIGKTDEHSKKMYKAIVDQGHTLGMHSYSHNYNTIYKSVKDFDKDFTKLRNLLYDTTGYLPNIYRFPGGSGNSVMKQDISVFINYLNQKKVTYFDWNVVSGDAAGVKCTTKQLYDNAVNGIKIHSRSIVLMHDTDVKENTVDSLKMLLQTLTEHGTEILPLNEKVTPIQQVKAGTVKTKN